VGVKKNGKRVSFFSPNFLFFDKRVARMKRTSECLYCGSSWAKENEKEMQIFCPGRAGAATAFAHQSCVLKNKCKTCDQIFSTAIVYTNGDFYHLSCIEVPCVLCETSVDFANMAVTSEDGYTLCKGCSFECNKCGKVEVLECEASQKCFTFVKSCTKNFCVLEKCEQCGEERQNGWDGGQIFCQKDICAKDMWALVVEQRKKWNNK
jgi:hypothetical protein